MEASALTSYGQVIEYIKGPPLSILLSPSFGIMARGGSPIANTGLVPYTDRLYLASYTHTPDDSTPFPYPSKTSLLVPQQTDFQGDHRAAACGDR